MGLAGRRIRQATNPMNLSEFKTATDRPLAGRVALVTGGAKRVGRAVALRLAREGMDVAITYHTSPRDADVAVEQVSALGRRAQAIQVDLSQAGAADHVYDRFAACFDRLDVLVNNASSFVASPLAHVTPAGFQHHMAINALAPLMLIQKFAALLSAGSGGNAGSPPDAGRVVNLVDAHVMGGPLKRFSVYNASKAALVAITKTCALELAPKVTVNAVAPGVVAWPESFSVQQRDRCLSRVPLGRVGSPDDVAGAVVFLVRDAHYCTGQVIPVDGGRSLV